MLEAEMPLHSRKLGRDLDRNCAITARAALRLAALATIACLGACASEPQALTAPIERTWDGYLPTLAVSARPAAASQFHAESSRRDLALGVHSDVLNVPRMYPAESRPSLDYPRRYYFPSTAGSYTYFRTPEEARSDLRWRWGY